ncbi:hypothetical protein [Deinococcus yunweiensis]|uniref:hypothetical protein n=1 Tax=Deinococcus yunweiensis TaxID=367282 RepID=UPI00398F83EC
MSVHPSAPYDHAAERARSRFHTAMTHEVIQARLEQRPLVPVRPDATLAWQGETYAVQWHRIRFDSLSPTQIFEVVITRHSDGRRVEFGQVIRKQRRSKMTARATVRYTSPAGTHSTEGETQAALVELTAERLSVAAYYEAQPYSGPRNEGDQVACAVVWP